MKKMTEFQAIELMQKMQLDMKMVEDIEAEYKQKAKDEKVKKQMEAVKEAIEIIKKGRHNIYDFIEKTTLQGIENLLKKM